MVPHKTQKKASISWQHIQCDEGYQWGCKLITLNCPRKPTDSTAYLTPYPQTLISTNSKRVPIIGRGRG